MAAKIDTAMCEFSVLTCPLESATNQQLKQLRRLSEAVMAQQE